jgi:glyoxylase-like metal-dependent hydrolase (beta-lactamase superfamily II)
VHRIQLDNTVFEGQNAVYLIEADQTTLVDTAVATPAVRADLEADLERHGVGFADVDTVVLTHWHPDHAGLAGAIQAESGARVVVHAADAPIVDGSERETFTAWGMPAAARERLRSFFESAATGLVERDPTVTPVEDGDLVDLGGVTLETVHLPGHTAGLCGFAFDPTTVEAVDSTGGGRPSDARLDDGRTDDGTDRSAIFTGDRCSRGTRPTLGVPTSVSRTRSPRTPRASRGSSTATPRSHTRVTATGSTSRRGAPPRYSLTTESEPLGWSACWTAGRRPRGRPRPRCSATSRGSTCSTGRARRSHISTTS